MKEVFEILIRELGKVPTEYRHEEYNEAIHDVIKYIKRFADNYKSNFSEKLYSWIPCNEKMPEPGKRYLVSVVWEDEAHNYRRPAVYDAVFGGDGLWHSHNYEPVSYEVIAWQPLPEPYQPKGE